MADLQGDEQKKRAVKSLNVDWFLTSQASGDAKEILFTGVVMGFSSYADIRAHRGLFLSHAVADVKKWCAPAGEIVEGRKPSDQHWLRKFGTEIQSVDGEDARKRGLEAADQAASAIGC